MLFIKNNTVIATLLITISVSLITCSGSESADPGAPSRRTNAVIIGGTDTTNPVIPQAYAWINGAAFPLGDGVNPSEIFVVGGGTLFIGYQNNGSIDKAFFWLYEDGQFIKYDIGQGSIAGYSSRANWVNKGGQDKNLYVAGQYMPAANWGAILWKLDLIERAVISTTILDITQVPASANSINNSNSDNPGGLASGFVTIGGFKRACYWLNPVPGTPNISVIGTAGLDSEGVFSWIGGAGVITLGYQNDGTSDRACLWNNTTLIPFGTIGRNSRAFKLFQASSYGAGTDGTLYFVGYETNASGRDVACYWIWTGSAARHDLGMATRDSRALMVWTFEGNLYATGYEYSADGAAAGTKEACMWINGTKTVLSPGRAGTGNFIWDPYFSIDEN